MEDNSVNNNQPEENKVEELEMVNNTVIGEIPVETVSPKEEKRLIQFIKKYKKPIIGSIGVLVLLVALILLFFGKKDGTLSIGPNKNFAITSVEKESQSNYVQNNETFIVKTESGSLDEVEKHLYIEPAVNYKVEKVSKNEYKVVAKDIPSDKIVNVKYIDNKVVENAWAFQSTKDLTVTSVYPANETSDNSVNSTIEITFSYPEVDDINKSVVIEPKVEGTFEHNGRTWILKPTKPLKENQTYTITIKDDIKSGNTKLKEGLKTTFSTYEDDDDNKSKGYNSITLDDIETFRTTENPMFITKDEVSKIEMHQFNSSEDFRKYISNETNYKIKSLGSVSFKKLNNNLYMVNKKYGKGYYLLKAFDSKGKLFFLIPIQVNNLQAYLMTSSNDLLVWTSSNNKVQSNVEVSYEKNTVKTDKDGIAVIKKYNDKNDKLKYVKVGKDNPLYIGVENGDYEQYPHGYLYTDRPLYKNTDDVYIFGYIPFKYFENKNFNKSDFVLSLGEDTKIPIDIKDDGTFTTKYHLDNYQSDDMYLSLSYKDTTIANRYFEVKEYEKEMYDFKIDMKKNYVYAGEKFEFSVKVTHISGVTVPNKQIKVILDDDSVITGNTDGNGVAKFSIKTSRDEDADQIYHSEGIQVKSTLTESAQEGFSFSYMVVDRLVDMDNDDYNDKNKTFTAEVNTLSTNKNLKTIHWGVNDLIDKPYNGNAKIELEETTYTRKITGYEYNEITKENVPEYEYDSDTKIVKTGNYKIKNGKINYKVNYNYKKATEDVYYSYYLKFTLNDSKKIKTEFSFYVYNNYYDDYDDPYMDGYVWSDWTDIVDDSYYGLYNYYMPNSEDVYSVNNQIIRDLYSYNGKKETGNNKFLLIKYKNNIIEKKIINNVNEISTTFNDDDRPGIKITGAYLKGGNFYRLPSEYLDYNEQDSKLNIEIKPNKKTYKPQEEVTVNLKVTKKDKGVKAKVNVSVVDEGVFKARDDSTNILEEVYYDMYYRQYTYSTYRDYNLFTSGGGKGSTSGAGRSDFGDTIFFKTIDTDSNGNAKVKFKMNDSITSFRITAHATTDNVDLGDNHTNIESSLPISISFSKPLGVKESDDVVLNAIGIGTVNDNINYEFSIEGIKKKITKTGKLSQSVYANFGKLPAGHYTATIIAKAGKENDKVTYSFDVVRTQVEISVKTTKNIKDTKSIKPTKNPIKLEFYRDSYKTYEKYLDILKETNENRLDTIFTYNKALDFENKYSNKNYKLDLGDIHKYKSEYGYKYLPGDENVSYELTAILTYYDSKFAIKKSKLYKLTKSDDSNDVLNGYMNLAAQKEPILDDLKQMNICNDKTALAYLFLGDYRNARNCYGNISDDGIKVYISTFIDKKNTVNMIDSLYKKEPANRYVYLAMVSYFENNNAGLSTKELVTVSYGDKKEEIVLTSLGKKYLTVSQKELNELKIKSKFKDINVTYYYEGLLDELDNSKKIPAMISKISKNKVTLGSTVKLDVDIRNIDNYSYIDLYLPYGLTLGDNFKSDSAYVAASTKEHVKFYVYRKNSNNLSIPLYASSPGSYKIEPMIVKKDGKYQISNSLNITISEK